MNNVLSYFKEITKIPRPSKKEGKIREFLINFANKKGFEYRVDQVGNVIIYVPSNNGSNETIILQSHMDMVCVKSQESSHDFEKDPLDIYEIDGFLKARGTTLGADNGIGMAMMLAATELSSHPNLELLFTIDEEEGLNGANNLDGSLIKGKKLLNLDTEDYGDICISSAGGARFEVNGKYQITNGKYPQYTLKLNGMKGGHSGIEIDKKRGNAIYLWFEFLSNYQGDFELVSINGGTADNVIPSASQIDLGIENYDKFIDELNEFIEKYKLNNDCPQLAYEINKSLKNFYIYENSKDFIDLMGSIKIGVHSMSDKIPGLVNTSMNLGIINIDKFGDLKITFLARSSINSDIDNIIYDLKNKFSTLNFQFSVSSRYPGWQEDPNSSLVQFVLNEYKKYTQNSKLVAYHAGLECGILVEKIGDGCQAVSIGPNIFGAHTIEERVEIESINKMWTIIENILK